MRGEWITVPAADSNSFRAYLSRPARGSGPGLLLLQEIFGVNETMRADQLAEAGYVVVVPDLFWRLEPGVELDYSPEGWQRAFELPARLAHLLRPRRSLGDLAPPYRAAMTCYGAQGAHNGHCGAGIWRIPG
jgi:carboxymethylenebutenolidase